MSEQLPDAPEPEHDPAASVRTSFVLTQTRATVMTLRGLNVLMSMLSAPAGTDEDRTDYYRALSKDFASWRADLNALSRDLGVVIAVAQAEVDDAAGASS